MATRVPGKTPRSRFRSYIEQLALPGAAEIQVGLARAALSALGGSPGGASRGWKSGRNASLDTHSPAGSFGIENPGKYRVQPSAFMPALAYRPPHRPLHGDLLPEEVVHFSALI
jgi:hypothetical protein